LKRKIFYIWASDLRENSGEGILGNQFLSDVKRNFRNIVLININKNDNKYSTFFNKYIYNLFGAIKLWKYYYRGYTTIYVNYLPIWNFILFLILPAKTILGPITGSLHYNDQSLLDYLRRRVFLNILKNISLFFIFLKRKKILFSTDLLKSSIKKDKLKLCYFNYVLQIFPGFLKKKNKKIIDFLIYNRKHNNKNNIFAEHFIKNSLHKKYKITVVGDPINLKNINNIGFVKRKKIKSLLRKTKFTFGSSENLYTLFILDAISSDVFIFYDKRLKIFNNAIKYERMLAVDMQDNSNSFKYIMNKVDKYYKFINKNYFQKKNYDEYFK
jgi:hypothetical protein